MPKEHNHFNLQDLNASQTVYLSARPKGKVQGDFPAGISLLGIGTHRDGLIYVPDKYNPENPAPLLVVLHRAGLDARDSVQFFRGWSDEFGVILLAPDSRSGTWDFNLGEFGPDVTFIDQALEQTFERYSIDEKHIGIVGFSDGASYAVSLGLANGELFSHVIAFSPGFAKPPYQLGSPQFFISHGTRDEVLPVNRTSRPLVGQLKHEGYSINYVEFEGDHSIPKSICREAIGWFLGRGKT